MILTVGSLATGFLALAAATEPASASGPTDDPARYLQLVRAYADAMIEQGRDHYGKIHSPLFAAALERKNMTIMDEWQWPSIKGFRNSDRAVLAANPMHDENLYQVLYALSKITGNNKYAKEADKTLRWFFENCQSKGDEDWNKEFDSIAVRWPEAWQVFGPLPSSSQELAEGQLQTIPDQFTVNGINYKPTTYQTYRNIIDFTYVYGGYGYKPGIPINPKQRKRPRGVQHRTKKDPNTAKQIAYAFAKIYCPKDGSLTIGAGADWYMQWFLDGKPIFDTIKLGNQRTPIWFDNHVFKVPVTAGAHVLAVKVVAGPIGWSLVAAGGADFARTQHHSATGLLAWGEHMGWSMQLDEAVSGGGHRGAYTYKIHEFYRPWLLWEQSFRLAPTACRDFALGLWYHQVYNHATGDFSRHASYDRHAPESGSQFPRHGGFYIATWAHAYEMTEDPVFLRAIEALVDFYERVRSEDNGPLMPPGAIPMRTTRVERNLYAASSNLSLAIDLSDAAEKVPDKLAKKMRHCANKIDRVYLANPPERIVAIWKKNWVYVEKVTAGQVSIADVDAALGADASYAAFWAGGYGDDSRCLSALKCLERYRQNKREGFKKRFLKEADAFLESEPNPKALLYPGEVGDAISLETEAFRITKEKKYLDRADHFARIAVKTFFDGSSGLPRASSQHDHYEAITRADTLAMALLDLWAAKTRPDLDLALKFTDR